MLEIRKSSRRKMLLPVKVSIGKVTHLAYTIEITDTGARIGSFRAELQAGIIISVQRGSKKAEFRISWNEQVAPNELQKVGFVRYNGEIEVHSSLLNVVLHD